MTRSAPQRPLTRLAKKARLTPPAAKSKKRALPPKAVAGGKLPRKPPKPKPSPRVEPPATVERDARVATPRIAPESSSPGPAVVEDSGSGLTWLFLALGGTGAVFLAAVGSRRFLVYRIQGAVAAPGPPLPRAAAAPPALRRARSAARNGNPSSAPAAADEAASDTFEIGWARGYFKSDFYLATSRPGGGVSEVARSPAFRWTAAEDPPPAEAITAAHSALVEKLVALGWEEVGAGESWYARRYRRRADARS